MTDDLERVRDDVLAAISAADSLAGLEAVRVAELGRKGRITGLMKTLAGLSPDERREKGAALNRLRDQVAAALEARRESLARAELETRLRSERVGSTLPHRPQPDGRIHPSSQTMDELIDIFGEMGFSVAEGPDIEDDWHNFEALNIPAEHPARQEMDTFYLRERPDGSRPVLRTHTSPVQIRTMEKMQPPIRIISPGRT